MCRTRPRPRQSGCTQTSAIPPIEMRRQSCISARSCTATWAIVRADSSRTIAHVAVHERALMQDWRRISIGGIAEVCVHPDCRGRGLVRHMLHAVHGWLTDREFLFAMLFGKPEVYTTSGYVTVSNVWREEYDAAGLPHRKPLTP